MTVIALIAAALAVYSGDPPPRPVLADCSMRSMAAFPDLRRDADSVHVGPLVLTGGAYTPAETVREYGGDKILALVQAGRTVTVSISPRSTVRAALAYGPLPEGEIELRDAHQAVTFRACGIDVDSGSSMGDVPVTFWSGFVLAESLGCVWVDVRVGGEAGVRPAVLAMGVRCD